MTVATAVKTAKSPLVYLKDQLQFTLGEWHSLEQGGSGLVPEGGGRGDAAPRHRREVTGEPALRISSA